MVASQSPRGLVRPEWLFLFANRVQALAASAALPHGPLQIEKPTELFSPEFDLEEVLAENLLVRLDAERTKWAERQVAGVVGQFDDRQRDAARESSAVDLAVARAQSLLRSSVAEHWTVATLAARVACNRTDLELGFRRHCSCTVHMYLVGLRVAVAEELLRTTAWRVLEVAKAVGFRSRVSLYQNFLRIHRMTPEEYRRRWLPAPASKWVRILLSASPRPPAR